jgi:hypothetical protein
VGLSSMETRPVALSCLAGWFPEGAGLSGEAAAIKGANGGACIFRVEVSGAIIGSPVSVHGAAPGNGDGATSVLAV